MKNCRKCKTDKTLDQFYKGHATCKPCYIEKVKRYRLANIEVIRAYDRKRGNRQTPEYLKNHRNKYPNQAKAQRKVAYEVRRGNLIAGPCESCGAKETHAHQDDYLKPLNIRWLCAACHKQWHEINGEGLNRK